MGNKKATTSQPPGTRLIADPAAELLRRAVRLLAEKKGENDQLVRLR